MYLTDLRPFVIAASVALTAADQRLEKGVFSSLEKCFAKNNSFLCTWLLYFVIAYGVIALMGPSGFDKIELFTSGSG